MDTKLTGTINESATLITKIVQPQGDEFSLAVDAKKGDTVDELLARISSPQTLMDRPSQIILPLIDDDGRQSFFDKGPKTVVDREEPRMVRTLGELGTGIFCRGEIVDNPDLFNLKRLDIGQDPKKLDLALLIVKDLLNSRTLKKPSSTSEAQRLTDETKSRFKTLGLRNDNFKLEGLNIIFTHDSLSRFINNKDVAKAFHGDEKLLSSVVLGLLELNRTDADAKDKQMLEQNIRQLVEAQAQSRAIELDLNNVASLLNISYVAEVLDLLSVKNLSDSMFQPVAESQRKVDLIQDLASRKTKRGPVARLLDRLRPGKRESDVFAKICRAMYEEHNASNNVLGFNPERLSDEELEARAKANTLEVFSSVGINLNDRQHNTMVLSLMPNKLASLVSNNLIEGQALMVSPKTIMYLFLSLNMKRIGSFSKHERHDYAQSLANDLEKRGVDKELIKSLRKEFGDAKFADFITLQLADYLRRSEIFDLMNDDFTEGKSILKNGSIQAYLMDLSSVVQGQNMSPGDLTKIESIFTALGEEMQKDPGMLNLRDDMKAVKALPALQALVAPEKHDPDDMAVNQIAKSKTKVTEAFLDAHLYTTYSYLRMVFVPSLNLKNFLKKTFPYAEKTIPELVQDLTGRIKRIELIENATESFLEEVQGVVKEESFVTKNMRDSLKLKPEGSFFEMGADGLNHLAKDIASEIIASYDGEKRIEDMSLEELAAEPVKLSEKLSKKNFGQSLYETALKHIPLNSAAKERLQDILFSRSGKSRMTRRKMVKLGLAAVAGTGVSVAGGTAWYLNEPKPFFEQKSFNLKDLDIAFKKGDLENDKAKSMVVLRDVIHNLFPDNVTLQGGKSLSSPTISKSEMVFASAPLGQFGVYQHFKTDEFTRRYRDSEAFVQDIKESFEDSVFKNLNISEDAKVEFAKTARNRLHDLIDNYENNAIKFGAGKRIPAVFQPILMENPDPNKDNLIPIVFVDDEYFVAITLGDKSIEAYNNIAFSLLAVEPNFKASYNIYKVDQRLKSDSSLAQNPELETELKNTLDFLDRRRIFGSNEVKPAFSKVKDLLSKYVN